MFSIHRRFSGLDLEVQRGFVQLALVSHVPLTRLEPLVGDLCLRPSIETGLKLDV